MTTHASLAAGLAGLALSLALVAPAEAQLSIGSVSVTPKPRVSVISRDYCIGRDGKVVFCSEQPPALVRPPTRVERPQVAPGCAAEHFQPWEWQQPTDFTGRWRGTRFSFPVFDDTPLDATHPILPEPLVIHFDHDGVEDGELLACEAFDGAHACYDAHNGTDFILAGGFQAMDEGVLVRSAATGVVINVVDEHFDRCHVSLDPTSDEFLTPDCIDENGQELTESANLIEICHPDGTISRYAHIQQGSALVSEGQRIACGDPVARVGSSGRSAVPHLHFDVAVHRSVADGVEHDMAQRRDQGYVLIDPYAPFEADSLWVDQRQAAPGTLPGTTCQ